MYNLLFSRSELQIELEARSAESLEARSAVSIRCRAERAQADANLGQVFLYIDIFIYRYIYFDVCTDRIIG